MGITVGYFQRSEILQSQTSVFSILEDASSLMSEELKACEAISHSSIKVIKRSDRSWKTWSLHALLRVFRRHLGRPISKRPKGSNRLKPPASVRRKCTITERKVEDIWVYDFALKDKTKCYKYEERKERARRQRIYYFAGGGWQMPPDSSHWKFLAALLGELPHGATISLVSYPLAPRSPAPITFPQLMRLYDTELARAAAEDEIVTLMGDSSGGEIVLCLPLEALTRDPSTTLKPHSILAICPSVDLSRANPVLKEVQKSDPILKVNFVTNTAKGWAGDWDLEDPRISPLFSEHLDELANAGVRVDGCTAGSDILGPDGVLFRTKLARLGVKGEWLQWEKMMHVWPLVKTYGISPEADEAFIWIADLLRRRGEEGVVDRKVLGDGEEEGSGRSEDVGGKEKV